MDSSISRRRFLQAAAVAVPGAALIGCHNPSALAEQNAAAAPGPLYLNDAEKHFLDAATERLIPGDAASPGANKAGVTVFIDRQLSGPYGMAETWYMRGPWPTGIEEQGWQSRLAPAQMYRVAIRNIQQHCQQQYGKRFEALTTDQQDGVLHDLETGHLELPETSAKQFFQMLLHNTQEGFLADPMYGGNRDFVGWKLIGFPGPRYNYVTEIEQYGKPYTMPTVGLQGRVSPRDRKD
ncbi:MAG: gluconate 2-dehydrogenase subunit 3 family protein [Rhodanobacteraceae bacterium]